MVTDVIDFAVNGDKGAAVKQLHSTAVSRTADAFSGDVSAISDVSEATSMLAALRPGAGLRVARGPTVSQSAKAVSQVVKQVAKSKLVTAGTKTIERAVIAGGNRATNIAKSAATGVRESYKAVINTYKNYKPKNYVLNAHPADNTGIVRESIDALIKTRGASEINISDVSKLRGKGKLSVVAHGSLDRIGDYTGSALGRKLLENGYKGKDIELLSCWTGSGCASEQLEDATKAIVKAPYRQINVVNDVYGVPQVRSSKGYLRPPGAGIRTVKPKKNRDTLQLNRSESAPMFGEDGR